MVEVNRPDRSVRRRRGKSDPVDVLASRAPQGGLRARDLAQLLELELVPAKVEGLGAKLKRLVERGWVVQSATGCSRRLPQLGERVRHRARRRPMSMIIDHTAAGGLLGT
jgi:hypothetical protein